MLNKLISAASLLALSSLMALPLCVLAEPVNPPDTIVYDVGKKRVHVDGCRRLDDDRSSFTTMTLAEAEAKGLKLCSRCPGSTTQGRGNPGKGGSDGGDAGDLPESWVNPAPAEITQKEFVVSESAPLAALGNDGKLVYKSYSNQGDRLLDWSRCGYKQSEVPLPDVPVVKTMSPPAGEAKPQGNMAYPVGPDSQKAIEDALNEVAAMEPGADGFRGALLLTKGTYYISGGLRIPSGVVLRGEGDGQDGTVLLATRPADGKPPKEVILMGSESGPDPVGENAAVRITETYVPTGSTQITVEDASQFAVGDDICITKTVNEQWIEDLGMGERLRHIRGGKEGAFKKPWKPGSYQFRHYREITAIDGNTITLNVMMPQSLEEKHGGGTVHKMDMSGLGSLSGVESLRIVANYDTTVKDKGKDSDFVNFRTAIRIGNIRDAFVRNVTALHMSFATAQVHRGAWYVTVRDSKYLEPVGPKRGGNRYSFNIAGGHSNLFYNNYSEDGRHCFSGGSRVMGPNAFVKSTSVRGGQSEPHHRWGTGFLFDNITTKDGSLAAINRGDSGTGHGWAASNTLIWNSDAPAIVVFDPETTGENNFAIGYTGEPKSEYNTRSLKYSNDRSGYWGTPQEGAYYGYALMGNGHIESPGQPVEPQSLFIQQLQDRIGAEQAAKVLQ